MKGLFIGKRICSWLAYTRRPPYAPTFEPSLSFRSIRRLKCPKLTGLGLKNLVEKDILNHSFQVKVKLCVVLKCFVGPVAERGEKPKGVFAIWRLADCIPVNFDKM